MQHGLQVFGGFLIQTSHINGHLEEEIKKKNYLVNLVT